MHIAVIGAGAAGLCAARHITAPGSGMTCVVYEQIDKLGGTWVYTNKVGNDQYGLPIHSSMYKNLRTNLPKETMEFPGFPWKENPSYLSYKEVIGYLQDYAEHFNLTDLIKFHHHVTKVSPLETGWEVTACNLKTNQNIVGHFDSVVVCNGHYSIPDIPYIKGLDLFEDEIIHSHNYRTPECMLGKRILVIGGGPSGIDISWDMSKNATKIYFTHHSPDLLKIKFPSNIQHMPEVCEISNDGVIFEDNNSCQVYVILLCTGYKHNFPFFTPECEVVVEQGRYVQPFYKHMIHVYKPTLCIIGLVYLTFIFPMFDIQTMRLAIIGAGAAGLSAARHVTTSGNGLTCVVYEQSDKLGGTWVYTDEVGFDKYGLPLIGSMYKNLRTNLPKEGMEFLGFPWGKDHKSFLTIDEVINYLNAYADHFNLKEHIKFHHHVTKVSPQETGWEVTVRDLETNIQSVEYFDGVMVCSGIFSVPYYPDFKGLDLFQGTVTHSHDYRVPEKYTGKNVCVIGSGPSGIDISRDLSKCASKVYFSHHLPYLLNNNFPSNILHKPDVSEITQNGVVFKDNSICQIDVLMFCTGYKFSFPFLTPECGITVEDRTLIKPLYKHLIHVFKPSLCLVGILSHILSFRTFDTQVMFFLKALSGAIQLPNAKEMLKDTEEEIKVCQAEGKWEFHRLGFERAKPYLASICEIAQIPPVPGVIIRIIMHVHQDRETNLENYRNFEYRIIDDTRYTRDGVLH